jgi:hypothetical protein
MTELILNKGNIILLSQTTVSCFIASCFTKVLHSHWLDGDKLAYFLNIFYFLKNNSLITYCFLKICFIKFNTFWSLKNLSVFCRVFLYHQFDGQTYHVYTLACFLNISCFLKNNSLITAFCKIR